MTNLFVLSWYESGYVDVEVFDSMTLLTSYRLQKRILDDYSVHIRELWAGREEDKVVPVLNDGEQHEAGNPHNCPCGSASLPGTTVYLVMKDTSDFDPSEEVVHVASTEEKAQARIDQLAEADKGKFYPAVHSITSWAVDK